MAGVMNKFFNKINFTNVEPFKDTDVEKIVVHKLDSTWTIYLTNHKPLDVLAISELKTICKNGFDKVKSTNFLYGTDV